MIASKTLGFHMLIECFAITQYASYFWPGIYDTTTRNVTRSGFVLAIVLMAAFVAVNFLAMRIFARVNNVITWWKVAVPVLAIIVLLGQFRGSNFTAGGSFMPGGIKALFATLPPRASSSASSASTRSTSWPARSRTRSATCRRRSSSQFSSPPGSTACCRSRSSAPCQRA